jgi:2-dehydro-3-deoxygluconokinase
MLELTRAKVLVEGVKHPMAMNYGGDTINTSIYLARNDISVSYVTGLGDDITSDWLLDEWQAERVDCSLVARMPNSVPGMYMINVDDEGERSFLYWRKDSPASRLFDDSQSAEQLFQSIAQYDYLYLSGISLAILPLESRERLFNLLETYRLNGGKIVFDGNYRPNLWSSSETAQQVYTRMYKITDVALPTLEDETLLFGFTTAEEVMRSIRDHGVTELVVKMGGEGCLALHDGIVDFIESECVEPLDTTAAGDSFNAGYLSARFKGESGIDACRAGHSLASKVIQHRGAIMPVE